MTTFMLITAVVIGAALALIFGGEEGRGVVAGLLIAATVSLCIYVLDTIAKHERKNRG